MLGIIVLNYNSWESTFKCVESIIFNCSLKYKIYIIDNGSTNNSYDILSRKYNNNSKIEIINNKVNLGYAAGNNVGIRRAIQKGIEYCIITNNDVLFKKNTIENLYNFIKEKDDAIIIGPKILDIYGNTQHSSRLSRIRRIDAYEIGRVLKQKHLDEKCGQEPHMVYSVSGSCFIIDTNKFNQIRAFDEKTFLYNEENILGEQISQSPYHVYFLPNAEIVHEHGASTGKINLFVCTEYIKSFLYYWKKYRNASNVNLFFIYNIYVAKITIKSFWVKELKNGNKKFRESTRNYLKELYSQDYD